MSVIKRFLLYREIMSEYDEHREFLLNSNLDFKAVKADMLLLHARFRAG